MKVIAILAGAAYLSGCAALIPNTITPEVVHESHATQHQPFTQSPTRFGADLAMLSFGWHLSKRVELSLAEGVSLDHHYGAAPDQAYGEIAGPREQFIGRIGYTFEVRP